MTNKFIKWLTGKEETVSYNIPETRKVIVVRKAKAKKAPSKKKKAPAKRKPATKKRVKKTTKKK